MQMLNPFPIEQDMTVWIATNTKTRKVQQIRRDPRVCLCYADHKNAKGRKECDHFLSRRAAAS